MKAPDPHQFKQAWPHAPPHQLSKNGIYMVTSGTYAKQHFFNTHEKLKAIQDGLFKYATQFGWIMEAWAVFSNHYHFVARSPTPHEAETVNLSEFLNRFHANSAKWLNEQDCTPERKVWHNFWDTRLTHQTSYLARLNYVHQNPVKHGLVPVANQYPYCSARKFESNAKPATIKTLYSFKTNRIKIVDEYEPVWFPK
jgi:putative transposase